jgi:hypothetical protein
MIPMMMQCVVKRIKVDLDYLLTELGLTSSLSNVRIDCANMSKRMVTKYQERPNFGVKLETPNPGCNKRKQARQSYCRTQNES